MQMRIERQTGRYRMIAAVLAGIPTARAFLHNAPPRSGIVRETTGETLELALEKLAQALRDRDSAAITSRRIDPTHGFQILTSAEFSDALAAVKMAPADWAMLRAHATAGESGLTAEGLARAASWPDYETANLQYGKLAKRVGDLLSYNFNLLPVAKGGKATATYILASGDWVGPNGTFLWWMHPELIAAVQDRGTAGVVG